jgi:hypothetical protein
MIGCGTVKYIPDLAGVGNASTKILVVNED